MKVAEYMERVTAVLWVLLAVGGIALRLRRLRILYAFHCTEPADIRYHRSVIRSSWLRLLVKAVLLLGGLIALWLNPTVPAPPVDLVFWAWRAGILVVLTALLVEDLNVDRVRRLLGTLESGRWEDE